MSGGIKKTDIIEANLPQLAEELQKVGTEMQNVFDILGKKPSIQGFSDLNKITKETVTTAKDIATIQKTILDIEGRVVTLIEKEAKARTSETNEAIKNSQAKTQAIINEEKVIQAKIKTDKELLSLEKMQEQQKLRNTKAIQAEEGSYDQLNATLNQTIKQYKALSQTDRENIAIGGEMLKTIQSQDAQLKQLDATMGRNQRNVGNYKSGFNGLNFSIMQVGRELPSLAYGVNVFASAISNNIPMVTDEIKKARTELAALKAEGKEGVPIWKQLTGAIFSWQTALVVGLTVFTMYGKEITSFIGGLFKTTEAIDRLKQSQEKLNKVRVDAIGGAQKEITTLNLLYKAATDTTKSQNERNDAVNELQRIYPDYLGNISDEAIKAGDAGKAYETLKNRIIEAAKARAYADQIAENSKKILVELEPTLIKLQDDHTKALQANKKAIDDFNYAVSVGVTELDPYITNMNLTEGAVKKVGKEINKTMNDISQLTDETKTLEGKINVSDLVFNSKSDEMTKQAERANKEQLKSEKNHKKYLEDVSKDYNDIQFQLAKDRNKEQLDAEKDLENEIKRIKKQASEEQKAFTDETIGNSLALADEQKLSAQEVAMENIKVAKNEKNEIENIQHELTLFMIDEDIKAQQRILDTYGLEADAYAAATERIRRLRLQRGEEEIQYTQQTEEQKRQIRNETMQATAELLSKGLEFSQQIYAAQATRAQETYDAEMNAAGDSLEAQTLAKRKFEAEDKKIKQRQAIASKLQAVLDASLALALAIATTWKNPLLAALNIGAATLGLGMALATPIPQFAEGTNDAPSSFIAGEEGEELIKTKSGKMILTPNKPTLFSDNNLIGSTIYPHDQTQKMLANMAFNQVREVVDMRKTESHLASMDKQMKSKIERYTDSKGRTVIKRGSLVSTL